MNYIKELNAFRDWLLLNDLSTSEVSLWYTLMSVNNKTGWKEWFTAPSMTLQQLAKLSKQGVYNARAALKDKGLIEYRQGFAKKQAAHYRMNSLVNPFDQLFDESGDQVLTILKPKRKQNKNDLECSSHDKSSVTKIANLPAYQARVVTAPSQEQAANRQRQSEPVPQSSGSLMARRAIPSTEETRKHLDDIEELKMQKRNRMSQG